jgi:phosphatidylglycerophosphate synthase
MLGIVAAVGGAVLVSRVTPTTDAYAWKAVLVFAAISVLAIGFLREHHPFEHFGPANQITTLRAALLAVVTACLAEARTEPVAWVVALISVGVTSLDGIDGWLARRSGLSSSFGARFDMEIDALLILVLAVLAWQFGKAGAWVVLAGAMRYLFVAGSYVWHWLDAPLPPSTRRKAVCVIQIVGLVFVVSPALTAAAGGVVAAITLAALTWSFGVDVLWLWRHRA